MAGRNLTPSERAGLKPTVNELVAQSIQRELPNLNLMQAEALAFVAIRRLRKEDRKRGYIRVKKIEWLRAGI
jgi:hypothetical protein